MKCSGRDSMSPVSPVSISSYLDCLVRSLLCDHRLLHCEQRRGQERRQSLVQVAWCLADPAGHANHLADQFALFTEPVVSNARAMRLEENARSPRNCTYVYSLGPGTAAVAATDMLYSLLSGLTQWTQALCSSERHCFLGGVQIYPSCTQPMTKQGLLTHMHRAINDLSYYIVIIYKTWGRRA